jgi:hypothetical protein
MKNIIAFLTIVLMSSSSLLTAGSTKCAEGKVVPCEIESYLEDSGFNYNASSATIFSNFIVKENDELYTIDFMVTEDNELIILSKNLEEEFYKVDSYSSKYMQRHVVPVANVSAAI